MKAEKNRLRNLRLGKGQSQRKIRRHARETAALKLAEAYAEDFPF